MSIQPAVQSSCANMAQLKWWEFPKLFPQHSALGIFLKDFLEYEIIQQGEH